MHTHISLVGRTLSGRYRIDSELGRGGFGAVYRAEHLELGRPVAIKTLLASASASEQLLARFRREARLQAELRHPTIVRLLDFGVEADGLAFMVQEFIDGRSLSALLDDGPLSSARVVRLIGQLLDGLAEAHHRGIVHRDLKPGNLMVVEGRQGEEIRILDFGLARLRDEAQESKNLTATGQLLGTPTFMAPEQIEGARITPATDIYSVGVLLYLMLTGRRPFVGSLRGVLTAHLLKAPPALPPEIAPALQDLVLRALRKDPAQRPADAASLAAELAALDPSTSNRTSIDLAPPILSPASPPPISTSIEMRGALESGGVSTDRPRPKRRTAWLASVLAALAGLALFVVVERPAPNDAVERQSTAYAGRETSRARPDAEAAAQPLDGSAATDSGDAGSRDIGTADGGRADAHHISPSDGGMDTEPDSRPHTGRRRRPTGPAPERQKMIRHSRRSPAIAHPGRTPTARSEADSPAAGEAAAAGGENIGAAATRDDVTVRQMRQLLLKQQFDNALSDCRCDDARRVIDETLRQVDGFAPDAWRARHFRTCQLAGPCAVPSGRKETSDR